MKLDNLNQCINCGICLSECPTYLANQNELYSPRGRLILLQEYLIKGVHLDKTILTEAFDTCLYCGSCENACPLGVKTKEILNFGKKLTNIQRPLLNGAYKISETKHLSILLQEIKCEIRNIDDFMDRISEKKYLSNEEVVKTLILLQKNIKFKFKKKINTKLIFLISKKFKNDNSELEYYLYSLFGNLFEFCMVTDDTGLGGDNHFLYNTHPQLTNKILDCKIKNFGNSDLSIVVLTSTAIDTKLIEYLELNGEHVFSIFQLLKILVDKGNDLHENNS